MFYKKQLPSWCHNDQMGLLRESIKIMKKYLPLLGGVTLACACSIASADQFLNLEPNFMNGAVFVPLFTNIDTDLDGYPDKMTVRYNVYTAGTTTKSLATKPRTVAYPPVPCTSPVSGDRDFDTRFAGAASTSRRHIILDLYTTCVESGTGEPKEAHRAVLYSANVVSSGASWMKYWNGWSVVGATRVDWDSDGTAEMMLGLENPAGKVRVMFIQMSDGTIEADNTYTAAVSK